MAHITLIDGPNLLLRPLRDMLQARGYETCMFNDAYEALFDLTQTDLLIIDISVAHEPKSSQLIKAAAILVLTHHPDDKLPPWLRARHIYARPYPNDPHHFLDRLADYMHPQPPDLGIDPLTSEHLPLLFGITQTLSGHLDIEALFEQVLRLTSHFEADFASLLVLEDDDVIYYRSTQPGRQELTGATGRRFATRLLANGLEGWVLRHQQAVMLPNITQDSRWFRASYLPHSEHCVIAMPLALERLEAQGVYIVGRNRPNTYTNADLALLCVATTPISQAIENGLLFKNQSERSVQLALINEVSQTATSILSLDAMLRTVAQTIKRSFPFYRVVIHLYNPVTEAVELRATAGSDVPALITSHPLYEGLVGWSAATHRTILSNDVTHDPRYHAGQDDPTIRAELCVPIVLGNKTIGVLNLQSTQIEAFDKYHISAMETLVDQLAIAIENARLYDKTNQYVSELKSLLEIGQAVTSSLDLSKILTVITNHSTQLLNVAATSVVLRDDSSQHVWFATASGESAKSVIGRRMKLGQGIAGWVAAEGQPIIVPDVSRDDRFYNQFDQDNNFATRSILCVPLQTKGQIIGAIESVNKQDGPFTMEDLALLQGVATYAATAIEHAQLYEDKLQTIRRLAETQSQLIQSAKLAAVGELAAGVAHEINNPLTTIINYARLMLDDPDPTPEWPDDVQTIYEEARRARDIVRNLLDFARTDNPKRQPTDLNALIETAIALVYTKSISHWVTLRKSLHPLPEVYLDANQVKQVFVNLLNNAIQAMMPGEPAILTVTSQHHPADNRVTCQISDTGQGIPAEYLDKVFDPFFTTKEVGQGTGLGLSISYGIVEKHGGHISVESTPGHGSCFTVTFPVMDAAEEQAKEATLWPMPEF